MQENGKWLMYCTIMPNKKKMKRKKIFLLVTSADCFHEVELAASLVYCAVQDCQYCHQHAARKPKKRNIFRINLSVYLHLINNFNQVRFIVHCKLEKCENCQVGNM